MGGYGFTEWRSHKRSVDEAKRVAQQIGLKVINLCNAVHPVWLYFESRGNISLNEARHKQISHQELHPLVGLKLDDSLALSAAETALLLSAGDAGFLQKMSLAVEKLRAMVASMAEYKAKYEAFHDFLPLPSDTDGAAFRYSLTAEQHTQAKAYRLILNTLANAMYEEIEECAVMSFELASEYTPLMKKHFRVKHWMEIGPAESAHLPTAVSTESPP